MSDLKLLLINKPAGLTSHDVIEQLRRLTNIKKIGHSGTLDPFAEGLLIVAIGRESTKTLNRLLKLDKTYKTTLQLGAVSDTYDKTGIISLNHKSIKTLKQNEIIKLLKKFIGKQTQLPPIYSAKKINGQRLYQLARKGQTPVVTPHQINIYDIKLNKLQITNYKLQITISCSSGTYIRTLAHDIGQALGTGAYLEKLIRVQIGPFNLTQAIELKKLTPENWQKHIITQLPPLSRKTRVLAFGTFDLLHPGHINFINQAKTLGDELYLVIARDQNITALKHKLPRQNELTRLHAVKSLNLATDTMLGSLNLNHRYHILNKIKPDIIALGYDQPVNLDELELKLKKYRLNPIIKRLKPYHSEKYKTSLISK